MAKDFQKSDPIGDLKALIESDFNKVIRKTHASLTTKKHSPVYTGFFASSWKVANTPPKATQKVKDYKPWSEFAQIGKKKPFNPPNQVKARFPVTRVFSIKKSVFIGNKAKYAVYALEGGKIQNFVQGELGKLIKETMKDKKGKLFVASRQTRGLSAEGTGGQAYTEF